MTMDSFIDDGLKVDSLIHKVDERIDKVEGCIDVVTNEICLVDESLLLCDENSKEILLSKLQHLRSRETYLRTKENNLITEKDKLITDKAQIRAGLLQFQQFQQFQQTERLILQEQSSSGCLTVTVTFHFSLKNTTSSCLTLLPGYLFLGSTLMLDDIAAALPAVHNANLISKNSGGSASDFTASQSTAFLGFGFSNHCPFFDPTNVSEDSRQTKLWSIFNAESDKDAHDIELISHALVQSITVYNDLSKVPETTKGTMRGNGKELTVQRHHLEKLKMLFTLTSELRTSTDDKQCSLDKMQCPTGIVTSGSIPDGHFVDSQGHVRGIVEVKHNTDAPAESLRQGATEATNVAMSQLALGVNVDDVVIPVIGSNGYLMQFGAVIMLKPSFPVFVMISHVLDLTYLPSRSEAARILFCIQIFLSCPLYVSGESSLSLAVIRPEPRFRAAQVMALSTDIYHCKSMKDFFASTGNIQSSIFHFFSVMARIHGTSECREYAIFPICVREFDDDSEKTMIVFPKLNLPYRIGLPSSADLRNSFMSKLEDAMTKFHAAGVVHIDLYLSNLMWREVSSTEVQLKVIDWDSAHFIHELLFDDVARILSKRREKVALVAARKDGKAFQTREDRMRYFDVSLLRVLQENIHDESLQATDKNSLDLACINAQLRYLESP